MDRDVAAVEKKTVPGALVLRAANHGDGETARNDAEMALCDEKTDLYDEKMALIDGGRIPNGGKMARCEVETDPNKTVTGRCDDGNEETDRSDHVNDGVILSDLAVSAVAEVAGHRLEGNVTRAGVAAGREVGHEPEEENAAVTQPNAVQERHKLVKLVARVVKGSVMRRRGRRSKESMEKIHLPISMRRNTRVLRLPLHMHM